MHKKISFLSCLLALLLCFTGTDAVSVSAAETAETEDVSTVADDTPLYVNSETGSVVIIDDGAGLLTEAEKNRLLEMMKPVTEYGSAAFASIDNNIYYDTEIYAESYTDEHFIGKSGVLFLIDMDRREIYLDVKGELRRQITSSYADSITDNIYTYASRGDYCECACRAFEQVSKLLQGGRIAQPMKYISNLLLAVILAMLINYCLVMALSRKQKAATGELMSGIYHKVDVKNPKAAFRNQTKRYVPRSSGSSGSSGSHSSGGSSHSSHSSGGGHRF